MTKTAQGQGTSRSGGPAAGPLLPHEGGTVDDHGRQPGALSRVGTGSTASPSDPARVGEANSPAGRRSRDPGAPSQLPMHPARPEGPRDRYELAFPGGEDGADLVEVTRISRTGPGGHPVYEDATGIVQAEISDQAEVRILATGGGQDAVPGVVARPLA
ncbi:DUF6296 family protein [Streptomyces sp. NPDC057686]|uniref:DUF6296 family protein n=1 Tax=Streptomyces sp. NPDC057686 TaxID=3346212 RepID=UPI0036805077